jgi:hypothetical protein
MGKRGSLLPRVSRWPESGCESLRRVDGGRQDSKETIRAPNALQHTVQRQQYSSVMPMGTVSLPMFDR